MKARVWPLACSAAAMVSITAAQGWAASPEGGQSQAFEMDPIAVTATGVDRRLSQVPASVTVLQGETLEEQPSRDLFDALRNVPGISASGVGLSGRRTLQLRGLDSSQSLVLVDGRRTNGSDAVIGHSDYRHGWMPLEAIERVEVIRGPMSALYGSDAMGGVINVITKPIPEQWQGSVTLQGGAAERSGGERGRASIQGGGPVVDDTLGLRAHASYARENDKPDPDNGNLTEFEGRDPIAGGAELAWTPAQAHTIRAGYDRTQAERWRNTLQRGRPPLHESRYDITREQWSLSHDGDFGALRTQLRTYRSSLEQANSTDNQAVSPTARQKLINDVVDGHLRGGFGDSHSVTFGAEYRDETLEHPELDGNEDTLTHRSVFLQDEWFAMDGVTATLGGRLDDHEIYGSEFSPRGYLNIHPTRHVTLKAGYGEGFRAPTIKQISPEYEFNGPHRFRGNPNLDPETVASWELGAEFRQPGLALGVTAFRNNVDDLLADTCIQNCQARLGKLFEHVNIDSARITGLESFVETDLGRTVQVSLNHTWLDTENRDTGETLPERPEHAANLRFSWEPQGGPWRTYMRGRYTGTQDVSTRNGHESVSYFAVWNAGVVREFGQGITLRLQVENLTDERPQDDAAEFPYPERGRGYFVTASMEL